MILMVGAGSKVCKCVMQKINEIDKDLFIAAPARKFNSTDYQRFFIERVVIFGYSKKYNDNLRLITEVKKVSTNIIYISTASVEASERGYKYSYPRVKRMVEQHLESDVEIDNLKILRLGYVEGASASLRITGTVRFTSIESLINEVKKGFHGKSTLDVYTWCVKTKMRPFEKQLFKLYSKVLGIHPVMGTVLRPIDFVLKKLRFSWYGYVAFGTR